MTKRLFFVFLAMVMLIGVPRNAGAVSTNGTAHNVPYVMGFHIMNSNAHPYLGQLHLNFSHGVISGTYTDISIKPGSPFANAVNVSVSGGVSKDHVTLVIGHVTFRGTMNDDGRKMSGSANIRGAIYVFAAEQGSPGSGR